MVQVAVGPESVRALGSAGRELGEPRLRLEEVDGGSETRSLGRSCSIGSMFSPSSWKCHGESLP